MQPPHSQGIQTQIWTQGPSAPTMPTTTQDVCSCKPRHSLLIASSLQHGYERFPNIQRDKTQSRTKIKCTRYCTVNNCLTAGLKPRAQYPNSTSPKNNGIELALIPNIEKEGASERPLTTQHSNESILLSMGPTRSNRKCDFHSHRYARTNFRSANYPRKSQCGYHPHMDCKD